MNRPHRLGFLCLIVVTTGCNLLTPLVFVGEHRKKILPEFDKLPNSRVAILVWTEPATLFDYPYARFELATYVRDKLQAEMSQRNLGVELADPRDVEDYIQRNIDARLDAGAVGRAVKAHYVLYLEVSRFQVRDPDHAELLRGIIEASVSVYDLRNAVEKSRRFELTPVRTEFPGANPVFISAHNAALIRETLYRKFAEEVARKFYEYTVEL